MSNPKNNTGADNGKEKQLENSLALVRSLLAELDYGSITLVVQDGNVVQVEQNKKVRIRN